MPKPRGAASAQPGSGVNWSQVGILYRREMRAAFRERTIVINSVLIPIFLYPLLLWIAFSGLTYISGQTESMKSRIVVHGWPKEHPALQRALELRQDIELMSQKAAPARNPLSQLRHGEIDALLQFLPATNSAAALPANFQVQIIFNQSSDRSTSARDRLSETVKQY